MPRTPTHPSLAYEVAGQGTPVFFVMGFCFPGVAWQGQAEVVAKHHRVCTFDNLGVGTSDPNPRRFSRMVDLADDAFRVLDAFSSEPAHLVGVSMGGMIAQHMATRAPGRFRSLSLIATSPGGALHFVPTLRGLRHFARANTTRSEATRQENLQRLLYTAPFLGRVSRAELAERTAKTIGARPPRQTAVSQLAAVLRHDARRALRSLTLPTLVMQPMEDLLVKPKRSDALHRLIPNAELVSVAAGHGITFEASQRVNEALLAFFRRTEAATRERAR